MPGSIQYVQLCGQSFRRHCYLAPELKKSLFQNSTVAAPAATVRQCQIDEISRNKLSVKQEMVDHDKKMTGRPVLKGGFINAFLERCRETLQRSVTLVAFQQIHSPIARDLSEWRSRFNWVVFDPLINTNPLLWRIS